MPRSADWSSSLACRFMAELLEHTIDLVDEAAHQQAVQAFLDDLRPCLHPADWPDPTRDLYGVFQDRDRSGDRGRVSGLYAGGLGLLSGLAAPPWSGPRDGHLLSGRLIALVFSHEEVNPSLDVICAQKVLNVRSAMEAYRDNIGYEQIKSISNRIDKKDNNKLIDFTIENPISIVKWEPYNHIEIEVKRLELNDIKDILAQKELELATLEGELHAFELKYLRIVGVYFAELDDIRAKIAEAVAQLYLEDDRLQEEAARARAQARESAEASDTARSARDSISAPFNPSAAIKTLFREIAKRLHPDLGSDDEDRLRRHQFMAEANQAYRSGDEFRLQAIIREWDATLKSVSKDAITRFEQMIQKISQAKDRLRRIQITIDQLQHSDLNQLKERAEAERKDGEDLFLKMSEHLQREISQERARLSEILQRSSPR